MLTFQQNVVSLILNHFNKKRVKVTRKCQKLTIYHAVTKFGSKFILFIRILGAKDCFIVTICIGTVTYTNQQLSLKYKC